MADIIKTIGAVGRDYPDIPTWEADLDDGSNAANDPTQYQNGDTAIGVLYADSVFEMFGNNAIDGGQSLVTGGALDRVELTVDPASQHGGVFGAGVILRVTSESASSVGGVLRSELTGGELLLEGFEIDCNGLNVRSGIRINRPAGTIRFEIHRVLVRDSTGSEDRQGIYNNTNSSNSTISYCTNCVVTNIQTTSNQDARAFRFTGSNRPVRQWNNTAYDVSSSSGFSSGCSHLNANSGDEARNLIYMNCGVDISITGTPGAFDYCVTSDATATGPNSAINQVATDIFTDVNNLDFSLKPGTPAIAGVDLGTPFSVNIDVTGRDRDAEGDDWSMGAYQFVGTTGITLDVEGARHPHQMKDVEVSQAHVLGLEELRHAHRAAELGLVQAHVLALEELRHPHQVKDVELSETGALVLEELRHAHRAAELGIVQAHVLALEELRHPHQVKDVSVTEGAVLFLEELLHGHRAETVVISEGAILAILEATHAHRAGELVVSQAHVLEVAQALHAHRAATVIVIDDTAIPAIDPAALVLIEADATTVIVLAEPEARIH